MPNANQRSSVFYVPVNSADMKSASERQNGKHFLVGDTKKADTSQRPQLSAMALEFVEDFKQFLESLECFLKGLKTEPLGDNFQTERRILLGRIVELREFDIQKLLSISKPPISDETTTNSQPIGRTPSEQERRKPKIVHVPPMPTVPPQLPDRNKGSLLPSLKINNDDSSSGSNSLEVGRNAGGRNNVDSGRNTVESENASSYDGEIYDEAESSALPASSVAFDSSEVYDDDIYDTFEDNLPAAPIKKVQPPPVVQTITPVSLSKAAKSGNLSRKKDKKGILGRDKKFWCALDGDNFYTFSDYKSKEPKTTECVKGCEINAVLGDKKQTTFEILYKNSSIVSTMTATSTKDMQEWVDALQRAAGTVAPSGGQIQRKQSINSLEEYADIDSLSVPAVEDEQVYEEAESTDQVAPNQLLSKPPFSKPAPQPSSHGRLDDAGLGNGSPDDEEIYDDVENTGVLGPSPSSSQAMQHTPFVSTVFKSKAPVKVPEPVCNDGDEDEDIYDDGSSLQQLAPVALLLKKKSPQQINYSSKEIEEFYLAKWDIVANNQEELSVKKGTKVKVTDKRFDKDLWWKAEMNGIAGLVPKTFLRPAYERVS